MVSGGRRRLKNTSSSSRSASPGANFGAAVVEIFEGAHGVLVRARDVLTERLRERHELFVGNDVVHEPDAVRLARADEVPGEAHLARLAQADRLREQHAHPAGRREAHSCVRVAEAGALRRDEEVTRQRQLESARGARTVDRADDRRVHARECRERRVVVGEGAGRDPLTELLEVEAGAERGIGTGQHDARHRGVVIGGAQGRRRVHVGARATARCGLRADSSRPRARRPRSRS